MSIVVVGSVGLDSIKTPFGKVREALGGSASHAAVAASFYSKVNLVGVVGEDFPKVYLRLLKTKGVDLAGLKIERGKKSFRWDGFYEYDMNQAHSLKTDLNVLATFSPRLPDRYRRSPYLLLANSDPDVQRAVLKQMVTPRFVMMDTMNFWIENKRDAVLDMMKRVNLVLMNDGEIRQLTEIPGIVKAARKLLSWGVKAVVVKKGEHGALYFDHETQFNAPPYPLEDVKDPTGAGDSFAGGFIGYLAKTGDLGRENIRRAVIVGTVMASFNVEAFSLNRMKQLKDKEIILRFDELRRFAAFEALSLADWV